MSKKSFENQERISERDSLHKRVSLTMSRLDKKVVGQTKAKIQLSHAFAMHIEATNLGAPASLKRNVLIKGPSGSGKTELIKALFGSCDLPCVSFDATRLVPSGFKGDGVQTIINDLIAIADGDLDKAERGIVFLDEIDKVCASLPGDVVGSQNSKVTAELLKMIEGTDYSFQVGGDSLGLTKSRTEFFSTKNVLFIAAGAFGQFSKEEKRRCISIADAIDNDEFTKTIRSVLSDNGVSDELLGRFSCIVETEPIRDEAWLDLLINKVQSDIMEKYDFLLKKNSFQLELDDSLRENMRAKMLKTRQGTRLLYSMIEDRLAQAIFSQDVAGTKVILTRDGYEIESKLDQGVRKKSTNNELLLAIQSAPAFESFGAEVEAILKMGKKIRFSQGSEIISVGQRSDSMFLLLKGTVVIQKTNEDILCSEHGTLIGGAWMITGGGSNVTVLANTAITAFRIPIGPLKQLLDNKQYLKINFLESLASAMVRSAA